MSTSTNRSPLQTLIEEFKYEQQLTSYLDNLGEKAFDEMDILKITLWKVARFPHVDQELIHQINILAYITDLNNKKERKLTKGVLKKLLNCKGVRLPMASTYLRFRNPKVFQIIDRHMWKQIMFDEFGKYIDSNDAEKQIETYFKYLEVLRKRCVTDKVRFEDADRIYYLKDKQK